MANKKSHTHISRKQASKKRKFRGNQHSATPSQSTPKKTGKRLSASASKLSNKPTPKPSDPEYFNFICSSKSLTAAISQLPCAECGNSLAIELVLRYGLALKFKIGCSEHNCEFDDVYFWTSNAIKNEKPVEIVAVDEATGSGLVSVPMEDDAHPDDFDLIDAINTSLHDVPSESEHDIDLNIEPETAVNVDEFADEAAIESDDNSDNESLGEYIDYESELDEEVNESNDTTSRKSSAAISEPSDTTRHETRGGNFHGFEINRRFIAVMREIGRGPSHASKVCALLDMHKPVKETSYDRHQDKLTDIFSSSAEESMRNAAAEELERDIAVTVDGTWQKRGHNSLNGLCTIISATTKKCLDYQIETMRCHACSSWTKARKTRDPVGYKQFREHHICKVSHTSSSGSMESSGAVKMFNRSEEKNDLQYTLYIGDGDTASFKKVKDSDPYPGKEIKKGECVGHLQKRVGTRLRHMVKVTYKDTYLSDKKKLSGKGRLTGSKIDFLQNCYGMAIRQNLNDKHAMAKSVEATLLHYTDIPNPNERHIMCPQNEKSWCKWWVDQLTGSNTYEPKNLLPIVVKNELSPVFKDLAQEELLEKAEHGLTQNPNESINAVIWYRCPKSTYVERKVLSHGVASAVLQYNDGQSSLIEVFKKLGFEIGQNIVDFVWNADKKRIHKATRSISTPNKRRRKVLRRIRKGIEDKNTDKEGGESYVSGQFSQ